MAHPRIAIAPNDDPRWAQARAGDIAARNSLVEEHIRLLDQVTAVVCARLPSYVNRDDVWSFGSFGLIRAVETYDSSIASFRTHAVFLIKARIYDELRSMDWVPKSVRKKIRDVAAARSSLEGAGMDFSDAAVASLLNVDISYVCEADTAKQAAAVGSLDDAGVWDLSSAQTGPHAHDSLSVSEYLHTFSEWVGTLKPEEQAVWSLRFYCRMTTKQVAEELGVEPTLVSQISSRIFQSFHGYVDNMLEAG